MIITIYTLSDPITNKIRYIGRTRKTNLSYRLTEHSSPSKSNHNTYKKNWINKLKKQGFKATIEEIEILDCTWEESHIIEKYWIQQFKAWGFRLVNLEDKGKGGYSKYKGHSDKAVIQYNINGEFVNEYKSIKEASRQTEVRATTIEKVLWNIAKLAGNFQWKYKTKDYPMIIPSTKIRHKRQIKKVVQYDLDDNLIKNWNSSEEASKELGYYIGNIRSCANGTIKKYKNFKWKYENSNY